MKPLLVDRCEKLSSNFAQYVEHFETLKDLFSGPSIYFHRKVIARLTQEGVESAITDESFYEALYATLTAWGMHRMGKSSTRLRSFACFCESIRQHADEIVGLSGKRLCEVADDSKALDSVDRLIHSLNLGIAAPESRLVCGSKALHHLLPELVPPIDREYTLRFFYDTKNPSKLQTRFLEMAPWFCRFAAENARYISHKVGSEGEWHTSTTKVIDNAIIGFVFKEHLKPNSS